MRVLVLDLDPQGNASTALNIPHHAEIKSLYEVLLGEAELEDVIQISSELPGLYCVPATIHLTGVEMEIASAVAREQRLKTAIERYLETTMTPPDYIFIDCPPSLGLLTINAWTEARERWDPVQCENYALDGADQLLKYIDLVRKQLNPKLELSTVLLTMYDGRTRLAEDVVNFVRTKFPNVNLKSVIPRAVRVSEAPSFNRTVITHDKRSPGAIAYLEAAIEIAQRGEQLGR
jgi:chromosome partitioning protein